MTCHMLKDLTTECGTVEFALQANPNLADHLESCESCHAFFKEEQALDSLLEQGQPQLATDLPPLELRQQTQKTFLFQPWMGLAAMLAVTAFLAFWAVPKLGQPNLDHSDEVTPSIVGTSNDNDQLVDQEAMPKQESRHRAGNLQSDMNSERLSEGELDASAHKENIQVPVSEILESPLPIQSESIPDSSLPESKPDQAAMHSNHPPSPKEKLKNKTLPSKGEELLEAIDQINRVVQPMNAPSTSPVPSQSERRQGHAKETSAPFLGEGKRSKTQKQPFLESKQHTMDINQNIEPSLASKSLHEDAQPQEPDRYLALSQDSEVSNRTNKRKNIKKTLQHETELDFQIIVHIPVQASSDLKRKRLHLSVHPKYQIPVKLLSVINHPTFPFSPGQTVQLELDEPLEPGFWALTLTTHPTIPGHYLLHSYERCEPPAHPE